MSKKLVSTLPSNDTEPFTLSASDDLPVSVQCSRFCGKSGVVEVHWIIRPERYASFEVQLEWVHLAYEQAVESMDLKMDSAVWRRFLCSDLQNQSEVLKAETFAQAHSLSGDVAVSLVTQPPSAPAKVALWAHHIYDPSGKLKSSRQGDTLSLDRGELTHYWTMGVTSVAEGGSYSQTRGIFDQYEEFLLSNELSLVENVVRTWFFNPDVDGDYAGLVAARNEEFDRCGLTSQTHYIASTGIQGGALDVAARTMLDSYAIGGLRSEQITHLCAEEYLSPTHIYGVAFERGTRIDYRDRSHIFISGTASIDAKGEILFPGDIFGQLDRTLVNIEALLAEAGAAICDMKVMLVYLRDSNDHGPVREVLGRLVPDIPLEIVTAPVCRPGWLIEIEGFAVVAHDDVALPSF